MLLPDRGAASDGTRRAEPERRKSAFHELVDDVHAARRDRADLGRKVPVARIRCVVDVGAQASRLRAPAVPMTVAPRALAHRTSSTPTLLEAPCTRIVLPTRSRWNPFRAAQAVRPLVRAAPACFVETSSGSFTSASSLIKRSAA
jgi:hypothetical protein